MTLAGWTMWSWPGGGRDDPRRRLQLRHGRLGLAVRALLHASAGAAERPASPGRWPGAPAPRRRPAARPRPWRRTEDGQEPSATARCGALEWRARCDRDDPERRAPGRWSFCAPPGPTGGLALAAAARSVPASRCRPWPRGRRHQDHRPCRRSDRRRATASIRRSPAGGRSRSGGWPRSPPPKACVRPGTRAGDARRRRRRRAARGGRRTRPMRLRRRSASSGGPHPSGS